MAADGAPSRMWIDLHRLVEGLCQTTGRAFDEVFAQLEAGFGFVRADPRRWPTAAQMFAMAGLLHADREAFLAQRRAWIAGQRAAKARSDRGAVPVELRAAEARVREHSAQVRATAARYRGKWGWERRGKLLRRERAATR